MKFKTVDDVRHALNSQVASCKPVSERICVIHGEGCSGSRLLRSVGVDLPEEQFKVCLEEANQVYKYVYGEHVTVTADSFLCHEARMQYYNRVHIERTHLEKEIREPSKMHNTGKGLGWLRAGRHCLLCLRVQGVSFNEDSISMILDCDGDGDDADQVVAEVDELQDELESIRHGHGTGMMPPEERAWSFVCSVPDFERENNERILKRCGEAEVYERRRNDITGVHTRWLCPDCFDEISVPEKETEETEDIGVICQREKTSIQSKLSQCSGLNGIRSRFKRARLKMHLWILEQVFERRVAVTARFVINTHFRSLLLQEGVVGHRRRLKNEVIGLYRFKNLGLLRIYVSPFKEAKNSMRGVESLCRYTSLLLMVKTQS